MNAYIYIHGVINAYIHIFCTAFPFPLVAVSLSPLNSAFSGDEQRYPYTLYWCTTFCFVGEHCSFIFKKLNLKGDIGCVEISKGS